MTHDNSIIKKIRIGVLMGGKNAEREVSFNSGRTICDHLDHVRYHVIPIFQTHTGELYQLPLKFLHRGKISDFEHRLPTEATRLTWDTLKQLIDFVYIALHGRYGEDGIVQGALELLDIPYLGSNVLASALGMDKAFHKKILSGAGITTPRGLTLNQHEIEILPLETFQQRLEEANLSYPLIVKPAHEGSSLGTSVVTNPEMLMQALHQALISDAKNNQVLVEEKIHGMEFVCVSLQNNDGSWFTLPITEVELEADSYFYDYEQKYMRGMAKKITPARCSKEMHKKIADVCIKASSLLNFSTISRIDGFLKDDGEVVVIDPNSLTGMAPATFLFHQAAQAGMNHTQLINFLLDHELTAYGFDISSNKDSSMQTSNQTKLRIGVLLGGDSNERETSLESGRNVCYKLSSGAYDVTPLFVYESKLYPLSPELLIKNSTSVIAEMVTSEQTLSWSRLPEKFDFIFNGLHGGKGENGVVQGMLEMLGLPYNGSGVLTSALCMNKFKTNEFLRMQGFDVPHSLLLNRAEWAEQENVMEHTTEWLEKRIKKSGIAFPLILKPYDDGCSVFVSKINSLQELIYSLKTFFSQASDKDAVMVEELISGMELTCGVLGNDTVTVLPPSHTVTKNDILTMKEKFLPGEGENQTPAPLEASAQEFVQTTLAAVYRALGCKGYVRIDCFYQNKSQSPTGSHRLIILEINTLPALTPATCIFHQAAELGISPMEFITKIVNLGFENHVKHQRLHDSAKELEASTLTPSDEDAVQPSGKKAVEEDEETTIKSPAEQPRPQAELRAAVPETMIMRMF